MPDRPTTGSRRPDPENVRVACAYCGVTVVVPLPEAAAEKPVYCSDQCEEWDGEDDDDYPEEYD